MMLATLGYSELRGYLNYSLTVRSVSTSFQKNDRYKRQRKLIVLEKQIGGQMPDTTEQEGFSDTSI